MKYSYFLLTSTLNFLSTYVHTQSANCEYYTDAEEHYICELISVDLSRDVTEISGEHEEDKNDDKVWGIYKGPSLSLSNFPSIICKQFKNIDTIDLKSAGLEKIYENSFENCKNTEKIIFVYNKLKKLSRNTFASQGKLLELHLGGNQIEKLSPGVFDALKNIRLLSLSSNKLTSLDSSLFLHTKKLKCLYLRFNQIKELPDNVFTPMKSLLTLWLQYNNLTTMSAKSFGHHLKFREFNFTSNHLVSIDEKIFHNNVALKVISGSDNPCVEGDADFKNYTKQKYEFRLAFRGCFDNYKGHGISNSGSAIGNYVRLLNVVMTLLVINRL